jgi:hypothetical protein
LAVKSLVRWILTVIILAGVGGGLFATRDRWLPLLRRGTPAVAAPNKPAPPEKVEVLELSPEARRNLGLVIKPLKLQTYWRTIQLPGTIVDRPGWSDRGITSPAVAVVSAIHAYPGDTVRPGDKLFSLRVFSEYLQNTQSELFKATRETELIGEQYKRIKAAADSGAVPAARAIELENQLRRQNAAIQAFRQDLLTRGFSPSQIESVTEGNFVSTIEVVAPPPVGNGSPAAAAASSSTDPEHAGKPSLIDQAINGPAYEIEELKVDLGHPRLRRPRAADGPAGGSRLAGLGRATTVRPAGPARRRLPDGLRQPGTTADRFAGQPRPGRAERAGRHR